jgi:hypothetical protein
MLGTQAFNFDQEFSGLDFNSSRLEKRFIRTMETLAEQPDKSIWSCSENRAEAKAIYRMLGNENLDLEEILRTHREATVRRMIQLGETVLALQDTTSLNYNTHEKTEGIGYISDKTLGVNIHSCLGVTASGLTLGLLDQTSYNRTEAKDGSRSHESKKVRELEEKESFRWVKNLKTITASVPLGLKIINVCDREGDMYELFDAAETEGQLFLIRAAQNRMTADSLKILDEVRKKHCMGKAGITIPRDSRKNIEERDGILQIRYGYFEIKRPHILNKNKALKDSIGVWVIYAKEENPPKGEGPIEWFLMTNEPIESVGAAYERVCYYTQRWKIERFHYVLKSGCAVEKLQERSIDKTTVLVLMYSVIAVVIMNMTYIARIYPEAPCTIFFEEEEWKALYCTGNKSKKAPKKPYSMQEAVTYLGRLGGPKRAPSDGPPGLKTVWIGLSTLNTLLAYREWLHDSVGQV